MTEQHLDHFDDLDAWDADDLDAWDADDYDTAEAAVDSITNDIVFRPPEPPPPPAAIAAWWHDRRNRRRLAPSDARSLSHHIAFALAHTFLRDLATPDIFDHNADAYSAAIDGIADRMISHAPRDLERLETEITDADDPICQPIAEHLNECLNQIAALSPTDVRLSTDAADAWRDTLE